MGIPHPVGTAAATGIFAKGFDAEGKLVGTKLLPYQGASQIYDALWGGEQTGTHCEIETPVSVEIKLTTALYRPSLTDLVSYT